MTLLDQQPHDIFAILSRHLASKIHSTPKIELFLVEASELFAPMPSEGPGQNLPTILVTLLFYMMCKVQCDEKVFTGELGKTAQPRPLEVDEDHGGKVLVRDSAARVLEEEGSQHRVIVDEVQEGPTVCVGHGQAAIGIARLAAPWTGRDWCPRRALEVELLLTASLAGCLDTPGTRVAIHAALV